MPAMMMVLQLSNHCSNVAGMARSYTIIVLKLNAVRQRREGREPADVILKPAIPIAR